VASPAVRKTLFLNPPSFDGFDGAAGARYQARREIRSFWYPTWLAQAAALVPGSRLVDAPPAGLGLADVLPLARDFELAVLYTSTPSFAADVRTVEALRDANPRLQIGLVGPHVAALPGPSLAASRAIDFVAGSEFDYTILEVAEGRPLEAVDGLSYRVNGTIRHNRARAILEDLDRLPFVVDVYRRDLRVEDYVIGEALYPYLSFYTGRGCRSRCTFCLWPQTIGGHRYRVRSPAHVIREVVLGRGYFPQVREFFFDDDTLTDDLPRAEAIARGLGPLGVTWSCNAKANVPFETLSILREHGLRLLVVGYESGNQAILNAIRKGIRLDQARRFSEDCHRLGIKIHGTFIVGLPGETRETIRETIAFAREVDPHTIQVSLPATYPGTALHAEARARGWLRPEGGGLVSRDGFQVASLEYPHLSHREIFEAVEAFYRAFYFRPRKIAEIARDMLRDPHTLRKRLREGVEFVRALGLRRRHAGSAASLDATPSDAR
jgi:hopanoid biosynthesis associated radical SAM protein HpnJ